jgi:hypothetical protein
MAKCQMPIVRVLGSQHDSARVGSVTGSFSRHSAESAGRRIGADEQKSQSREEGMWRCNLFILTLLENVFL